MIYSFYLHTIQLICIPNTPIYFTQPPTVLAHYHITFSQPSSQMIQHTAQHAQAQSQPPVHPKAKSAFSLNATVTPTKHSIKPVHSQSCQKKKLAPTQTSLPSPKKELYNLNASDLATVL